MPEHKLSKSIFSPAHLELLRLLRKSRTEAGLTQAQAAAKIGKPQSFISKCESGERRVDVLEFLSFCRVYGVAPGALLRRLETRLTS